MWWDEIHDRNIIELHALFKTKWIDNENVVCLV